MHVISNIKLLYIFILFSLYSSSNSRHIKGLAEDLFSRIYYPLEWYTILWSFLKDVISYGDHGGVGGGAMVVGYSNDLPFLLNYKQKDQNCRRMSNMEVEGLNSVSSLIPLSPVSDEMSWTEAIVNVCWLVGRLLLLLLSHFSHFRLCETP